MIKSMTGYAQSRATLSFGEIEGEIKSVNSRYLEINVRLPRLISNLEFKIRDFIKQNLTRGKVSLSFSLLKVNPSVIETSINDDILNNYYHLLQKINSELGLNDTISLNHLLAFKEIFESNENSKVDEAIEQEMIQFVEGLLAQFNQSRQEEGTNLKKDIQNRIQNISENLKKIKAMAVDNPKIEFEKQKERLYSLMDAGKFDEDRLLQELAILADKVDITEEVVRLESHIQLFLKTLDQSKPAGKKLNFLLQEFHRELNTMGVKTTITEISHTVVHLKEEVEKIREQIQNIE
ncbi:MAG: YicC family protein [Calditrichia bacterium]